MKTHKITNQIIEIGMHYANTKHTTQTIRETFWLPNGAPGPIHQHKRARLAARADGAAEDSGTATAIMQTSPRQHRAINTRQLLLCQRNRKSLLWDTVCFLNIIILQVAHTTNTTKEV